MEDKLGVYIHIPFCIQRCHYCDFATYAKDQIQANNQYVDHLCLEISKRKNLYLQRKLSTVYFGGGTPSLLSPQQIGRIINQLKIEGFHFCPDVEITMEVNPATLTEDKCEGYRNIGVNRISIGCQSFNDELLKACNREHNAQETRETINLVKKYFDNFSLDLLFSLPKQGLKHLRSDIEEILSFAPPHVSAYCLTLAEGHPMNQGRVSDDEQVTMFEEILNDFKRAGLNRYEISNFAKSGFESRHNNLYWLDENYWGLGLSAHSYKKNPDWGYRFWNPSSYEAYLKHVDEIPPGEDRIEKSFHDKFYEKLTQHESLTDFCHTSLRLHQGLNRGKLDEKFGSTLIPLAEGRLSELVEKKLISRKPGGWSLTERGVLLSNQVFANLLFTQADIDKAQKSPLF